MRIQVFLVLGALLPAVIGAAEAGDRVWDETYGSDQNEFGTGIAQTPDPVFTTGVGAGSDEVLLPDYGLRQNYPNPFNPSTTIEFELPRRATVQIDIFNLLGEVVNQLAHREFSSGSHRIAWDGTAADGVCAATGVYLYRIRAEGFADTRKMLLLK